MDDIHPLVLKVAGKLVPVAIGGMAADVKFLVTELGLPRRGFTPPFRGQG